MGMNWGWTLDEFSLWKALNVTCQQRKGLVPPLLPAVFQSRVNWLCQGVQDTDEVRWTSADPSPSPCCRHWWWDSHSIQTLLQLPASWASSGPWGDFPSLVWSIQKPFLSFLLTFPRDYTCTELRITQPLMMGIKWWDTAALLEQLQGHCAEDSQSHQDLLRMADKPAAALFHHS